MLNQGGTTMQSTLQQQINVKKRINLESIENVQQFIRISVEDSFHAGNPEVIKQLKNLAYAIKNSPIRLIDLINDEAELAEKLFIDSNICPNCGDRLFMEQKGWDYWTLVCDICGWE